MVLDVGWNFSGLVVVNVCKCGKDAVVKMHRGCTSCKRFDFHSAYLNGELEEEVFLEQPPNFAFAEPEKFVLKLKKGGRRSNKVIDDKDILWEDFCKAVPRMLLAMEEADWPVERIIMLASFWANLQVHELRSSRDPVDQKTLLLYQAQQRRLWHLAIPSPRGAYNISVIDETHSSLRDTF